MPTALLQNLLPGDTMNDYPRLIEHAFPLRQASIDSLHEKNVRHGHISTLHIWPARRPLAASRAVLLATLLAPSPSFGLAAVGLLYGVRISVGTLFSRYFVRDGLFPRWLWLLPLRDMLAFFAWLLSFSGNRVAWRGSRFILKPGGNLYFSVPVDKESIVYFNAHRAFSNEYVLKLCAELHLVEAKFRYGIELFEAYHAEKGFGTGLYHFTKN
ncbi:MAG: DUF1156 domain-containing protein [Verrucomicrobiota bacterium]